MSKRALELLAPAKNLACGKAAIDHGVDAVYIGAPRFGARAAAGNSVADIHELCLYAHQFGAKVYVTLNTLLHDDELDDAVSLTHDIADAGADALLIQDLRLIGRADARLTLHASTQTDNRNVEKVRSLARMGIRRVVLARELTVDEIREIHEACPDVELEVFVHGALCVSYSGACYASEYCFGRSANRGECAQFCRMRFDLLDADDKVLISDRHLLSLHDMNRFSCLGELIQAGVVSFKIEGRLKDVGYVKNTVSAYSRGLDDCIRLCPELYCRASEGEVKYAFKPDLEKTFNRGYIDYFLHGRTRDMASFDTPKVMGEHVGTVKDIRGNFIIVASTVRFMNGDGLCFMNGKRELEGFRVNRVEGNRLFPHVMPAGLHKGMRLWRNNDQAFQRILTGDTAQRKIPVKLTLEETPDGYRLTASLTGSVRLTSASATIREEKQDAFRSQTDNMHRQLEKTGDTCYLCREIEITEPVSRRFIPNSQLSALRRDALAALDKVRQSAPTAPEPLPTVKDWRPVPFTKDQPIMQCRYCLKHELGYCTRRGGHPSHWKEPVRLRLGDGRTFRLAFDCRLCQMNIYVE